MDIVGFAVVAVLGIVFVTTFAARLGVASPLLLVAAGVAVSLLPGVGMVEVEPDVILMGVLPPLLYSAAVSMPAMDFRRDFRTISGLSVVLVLVSSVLIGWLISVLVPGIDLAIGVALGAIVSPTDAVATTIVHRLGVAPRLVTVLRGESLLNDATALVLLRSALAASAVSVSLLSVAWDFVVAVVLAVIVGAVVGWLNIRVRQRVEGPQLGTAISFTAPFVAYVPVEHLGASGLVAAVTAGLVAGYLAPGCLSPLQRVAEEQNWRTVEFILEGGVFLLMGLELIAIVDDVRAEEGSVWLALWVAVAIAVAVNLIRAVYVGVLLLVLRKRTSRVEQMRDRLSRIAERMDLGRLPRTVAGEDPATADRVALRVERAQTRVRRGMADIDYFVGTPLGKREGVVLVWAGMRGVVTLAAAQTLPADTPERSLLILIAVIVAIATLVGQGLTLPFVVRKLGLSAASSSVYDPDRVPLQIELGRAAEEILSDPGLLRPDGTPYSFGSVHHLREHLVLPTDHEEAGIARDSLTEYRELRARVIEHMRDALLDLRRDGLYSSQSLTNALRILDADQISTELRVNQ